MKIVKVVGHIRGRQWSDDKELDIISGDKELYTLEVDNEVI